MSDFDRLKDDLKLLIETLTEEINNQLKNQIKNQKMDSTTISTILSNIDNMIIKDSRIRTALVEPNANDIQNEIKNAISQIESKLNNFVDRIHTEKSESKDELTKESVDKLKNELVTGSKTAKTIARLESEDENLTVGSTEERLSGTRTEILELRKKREIIQKYEDTVNNEYAGDPAKLNKDIENIETSFINYMDSLDEINRLRKEIKAKTIMGIINSSKNTPIDKHKENAKKYIELLKHLKGTKLGDSEIMYKGQMQKISEIGPDVLDDVTATKALFACIASQEKIDGAITTVQDKKREEFMKSFNKSGAIQLFSGKEDLANAILSKDWEKASKLYLQGKVEIENMAQLVVDKPNIELAERNAIRNYRDLKQRQTIGERPEEIDSTKLDLSEFGITDPIQIDGVDFAHVRPEDMQEVIKKVKEKIAEQNQMEDFKSKVKEINADGIEESQNYIAPIPEYNRIARFFIGLRNFFQQKVFRQNEYIPKAHREVLEKRERIENDVIDRIIKEKIENQIKETQKDKKQNETEIQNYDDKSSRYSEFDKRLRVNIRQGIVNDYEGNKTNQQIRQEADEKTLKEDDPLEL